MSQQYWNLAQAEHNAGRLAQAELLYRQHLAFHAEHADGWHMLGVAMAQARNFPEAIPAMRRACQLDPTHPVYANNLGEALRQAEQLDEAISMLQRSIQLAPNFPDPHYNLANALAQSDRPAPAESHYRQAMALRPNWPNALFHLGNLLREEGRSQEAVAAYREALELQPNWLEATQNLGVTYLTLSEFPLAKECYQRLLEIRPGYAVGHEGLAQISLANGDIPAAQEHERQWTATLPPDRWPFRLYGESLVERITPDADYPRRIRATLGNLLDRYEAEPSSAIDLSQLHRSGAEFPTNLAYHGIDDRAIKRRWATLFERVLEPVTTQSPPHPRLGVVVTSGHEGVFESCFGELVSRLDSRETPVEIVCPRDAANKLRSLRPEGTWRFFEISHRVDEAAAQIAQARFSGLHYWEIGTDSLNYFLPMLRPAPFQSTGWGWPQTSALAAVDEFLTWQKLDAPADQVRYTECLNRFEHMPTFYRRPPVPEHPRGRSHWSLPAKGALYFCNQSLIKWQPELDAVFALLLDADPEGSLVLFASDRQGLTDRLLHRLRGQLGAAAHRVVVLPWMGRREYLEVLTLADVLLETHPYGAGANTLADAFAVGRPLVAWPGSLHQGRWSAGVLQSLGLEELIAHSDLEVVEIAVQLAHDRDRAEAVRERIRERADAFFESPQALSELREWYLAHFAG